VTQKKADLAIAAVSIAWGTSYLLMKLGLTNMDPFSLIALRFSIAFIITCMIFLRRAVNVTLQTLGHSAVLGLILFGVFAVLMNGLKATTVSSAGFLTSTQSQNACASHYRRSIYNHAGNRVVNHQRYF